ncbi:MAG TPA: YgjP-like metallopeptidase domain-containing protein, partial [Solirubrobacteraceae bacterium]|nr:YgjP-like metallopeptidase domain-containing protein [Solirubrobacteraceae bacterium]
PWIERRLREAAAVRAELVARSGILPYLGEELRPVPEAGRTRAHRRGHELVVPARDPRPAIERWYRRRARHEAEPRLAGATAALGIRCTGLSIRGQRTRWGSCSSSGAVSLNWRLLLGPPEVLEYVVWHEACHLVVADHSRGFWTLLEEHLPGYRAPRRWLREKGTLLTLTP